MTQRPSYDHDNGWEPSPGDTTEASNPPKTLWYLTDALGSTIGLLEKDGRLSAKYDYDEFGNPLDRKKFDINWPGPDNLFGYTGLEYDYNSDLTYARARYYKAEIGRFVSEDTYKGNLWNPQSQNLYGYVENNPILYIDPSGHKVSMHYLTNFDKRIYPLLEEAKLVGKNSQRYWDIRSSMGLIFRDIIPDNDNNSQFKYLFEKATNTSFEKGGEYWAKNQLYEHWVKYEGNVVKNLVAGVIIGKVTKALRFGKKVLNIIPKGKVNVAKIGDNFGKAGTLVNHPGTKIDWAKVSSHGLEGMSERGVTREMAENFVNNGKALSQNNGRKHLFFTKDGAAVDPPMVHL